MSKSLGFWSYVHIDDQAERGRITQLAKHISEQYEMLSGETISIFVDKERIEWGDKWREKIESNLSSVVFFIPIITPRYLMSPECRGELQFFTQRAVALGIKELILPLLYVDFPEFHNKTTPDEIIKLINTFHWEDWTEIRFLDVDSQGYRRRVSLLAKQLVEANNRLGEDLSLATQKQDSLSIEKLEEPLGIVDHLAIAESTLPKWIITLHDLTIQIDKISKFTNIATADVKLSDDKGAGFGPRLIIAKRLSVELTNPVNEICKLCNDYASQLHVVDPGFRIIIGQAQNEINNKPESKKDVCNFFDAVHNLDSVSNTAFENIQKLIESTEQAENLSRDLRPVMRHLKQGLTIMVESRDVIQDWVHLIADTRIDCAET